MDEVQPMEEEQVGNAGSHVDGFQSKSVTDDMASWTRKRRG